jgi:flavin reductase (DIM6/NTAB) family NADH-FMN oxidoreductase RutF
MTVRGITPQALADLFRASMRIAPASVSLVTARGADGGRVPARSIGGKSLSVLRGTLSSQICTAEVADDYGTHTIFVGRIDDMVPEISAQNLSPLIWARTASCDL